MLGMLAAMAFMDGLATNSNSLRPKDIDVTPKNKPIPNGCKRYYFNDNGLCNEGEHTIFFDCLKKETAYKKFSKYLTTKQQP